MSYSKCWNWSWILKLLLNFESFFSFHFLQPNFVFWGNFKLLRCLNSKEIKLQSAIRVICTSFRSGFFLTISIFDANFNTSNMTWTPHKSSNIKSWFSTNLQAASSRNLNKLTTYRLWKLCLYLSLLDKELIQVCKNVAWPVK